MAKRRKGKKDLTMVATGAKFAAGALLAIALADLIKTGLTITTQKVLTSARRRRAGAALPGSGAAGALPGAGDQTAAPPLGTPIGAPAGS